MSIWEFPLVLTPYGTRRSAAKTGCTALVFVSEIFVAPYDSIGTMTDFSRAVDATKDKSSMMQDRLYRSEVRVAPGIGALYGGME